MTGTAGPAPQRGAYTWDWNQEPPCGQLRREGEAEKHSGRVVRQARGRHQGMRKGCNKEKEEEGRMRGRKGGLESEKPRERTGGADKESARSR